jgi:hypothetical protein
VSIVPGVAVTGGGAFSRTRLWLNKITSLTTYQEYP